MASAFMVWLAFPNFLEKNLAPWGAPLAWVALIPLFLSLENSTPKQAAILGYLYGFAQLGSILYWIAILEEAKYLGPLGWFALVGYLSVYYGIFAWITRRAAYLGLSPLWTYPVVWLGCEYFRGSQPWGGFNWGEIGYSQLPFPNLTYWAGLAGEYGLTFLIVFINIYWARLLARRWVGLHAPAREWRPLLYPLGILLILMFTGWIGISNTPLWKVGTVALLQASVDQDVKWTRAYEEETYQRYERLIRSCAKANPGLIVWPETGAPTVLKRDPSNYRRVSKMVRRAGAPELVGCLDVGRGGPNGLQYFNAGLVFDAQGRSGPMYHKCHLVPFGEFMPFQKYLSFLGPIVSGLGNFTPGDHYLSLPAHGFTYSPTICYEAIFPGDMRKAALTGADALVNISNDAWYGHSAAAFQHAQMGIMRSAELHRPLLRAANTGISYISDPFGRVLAVSGFFTQEALVGSVLTVDHPQTLFARWGNWLPEGCLWATFLLIVFGMVKRPRQPLEIPAAQPTGAPEPEPTESTRPEQKEIPPQSPPPREKGNRDGKYREGICSDRTGQGF